MKISYNQLIFQYSPPLFPCLKKLQISTAGNRPVKDGHRTELYAAFQKYKLTRKNSVHLGNFAT